MMRGSSFAVALLVATLCLQAAKGDVSPPGAPALYLPHPPIHITSDGDFLLPVSGVIDGSGTADDPYIIAGWRIQIVGFDPLLKAGIRIQDTQSHVLIVHNQVLGDFGASGIVLTNASNIQVAQNLVGPNLSLGILFGEGAHLTARGNNF